MARRQSAPPIEEHYTVETLARRLDRSPYRIRQLCRSGAFPRAVKDGPVWLIPSSDVAAWLDVRRPFACVS